MLNLPFQRTLTLLLVSVLTFQSISPTVLCADAPTGTSGQIERIETSLHQGQVRIDVLGNHLTEYYDVLNRDGSGKADLFVTFYGIGVAADVERSRAGMGGISSIDVNEVGQEHGLVTQVVVHLPTVVTYHIKKISDGIRIDFEKIPATAVSSEPVAMEKPMAKPAPVAAPIMTSVGMTPSTVPAGVPAGYRSSNTGIQGGDVLFISVSPAEELSRDLIVDETGRLSFPLVGAVDVAGRSPEELSRILRQKLSQYVANPKVDVFVKQSASQQLSLFGQVRSPGVYNYRPNLHLLDLVSQAGGFIPGANKRQIKVYRGVGSQRHSISVNVEEALRSGDATKDFLVDPGDLIEVSKGASPSVTIIGQVRGAGSFDYFDDARLLDLIAMAGGFSESANLKKIRIFRGEPPHRTMITVRFDGVLKNRMENNVPIQPGDIILVPQRALWEYSGVVNTVAPIVAFMTATATLILIIKK